MISIEQLTKWKEIESKATPGPWVTAVYETVEEAHVQGEFGWVDESDNIFENGVASVWAQVNEDGVIGATGFPGSVEVGRDDGEFIAASREMVSALIAEVERLRGVVDAWEKWGL